MSISQDELVKFAILGYQSRIAELQATLNGSAHSALPAKSAPAPTTASANKKRGMSEAARQRIAAAQKKRWAEYHKKVAGPKKQSTPANRPPNMTAARKAALVANLVKARAAREAKRKAA
jgi:hypothetical protein